MNDRTSGKFICFLVIVDTVRNKTSLREFIDVNEAHGEWQSLLLLSIVSSGSRCTFEILGRWTDVEGILEHIQRDEYDQNSDQASNGDRGE